jgi:hypothetical protein
MTNNKNYNQSPLFTAISLFITVVCLAFILLMEQKVYANDKGAWLHYLVFAPAYIALQYFFESVLSLFTKNISWGYRTIPLIFLLLFYAVLTSLS